MAFTASPETQTYGTDRIPLVYNLSMVAGQNNFGNPWSGMINVIPFSINHSNTGSIYSPHEVYGETRDPVNTVTVLSTTGGSAPVLRGMYVWEKTIGTVYYYCVVSFGGSSSVYTSTDGNTWTNVLTLAVDGTTPVRFTDFIDGTNTKKLVMVDGTNGYVFTNNTAGTKITDANFPTPHVPFPIFLDGYLFLAKAGTGDIYNSNLNDPTTWTAGNFLSAEMYPDDIQALVKINNYILAIGTQSGEYFYDAGNSPGTPLAKYDGATLSFGTSFPNSIAANHTTVMMLANNNDGSTLFKIIDGFQAVDVPASDTLKYIQTQYSVTGGNLQAKSIRGCFMRQNGELIYILNLMGDSTGIPTTLDTVAYSLSTKHWVKFCINGSNPFPIYFTSPCISTNTLTYCAGVTQIFFTDPLPDGHTELHLVFGYFDAALGQQTDRIGTTSSGSYAIAQTIYVPPQNFGTMNRKVMHRAGVLYNTTQDILSYMTLQWSDDLMNSFSTARQLAGVAGGNSVTGSGFPFITQLGSFRQRGFKVNRVGMKCRYYFLEVEIDKRIR